MPAHDEIVARAAEAARRADAGAIARAFVGSLATRNLPARSAFGSFAVLQRFTAHPFDASSRYGPRCCAACGLGREEADRDMAAAVANYPFQVQHANVAYAAFDLETFPGRPVDPPTPAAVDCLRRVLDALRALPVEAQLVQLQKSIGPAIKSNKHERMILLESFGQAGILRPEGKRDYRDEFVAADEADSDQPREFFKREWAYPVRFWTGRDGVDEARVDAYFGAILATS